MSVPRVHSTTLRAAALAALTALMLNFGFAQAQDVWVSLGGGNGAINVDADGDILARTTAVAQTFEGIVVDTRKRVFYAWNNVNGDNQFTSTLYKFGANGGLQATLGGMRAYGYDGGIPQKKMALDPASGDLYVTGGGYYAAEGGWYQGLQRFSVGGSLSLLTDTNLANVVPGVVGLDIDTIAGTRDSRIYVAINNVTGNVREYDPADLTTPLADTTVNNARRVRAFAEYRGAAAMAVVGDYNDMAGWNPVDWSLHGKTPGWAPSPPWPTNPIVQLSPSTNETWWSYFVGNRNHSITIVGEPDAKGVVVDDLGYMWLSVYETGGGTTNDKHLVRLNLSNGVMAAGFPISLTNEPAIGLALDRQGYVWMGTTNGGLYRISANGGVAAGSGSNLIYTMPPGALVFQTNVALVLGAGDATGYDLERKRFPPDGSVIHVR